jgi:hypothetical protein
VRGNKSVRIAVIFVALAALVSPALAGAPYAPPNLKLAKPLEPPADLRADATALLKAVQAEDFEAVGRWIAPKVTVVSGALEMGLPRTVETIGGWKDGRSALAELGYHTGGDWDAPPDVDLASFVASFELDFIEGSLTDGRPWGTDPLIEGAICTYGFNDYSSAEVQKVADQLNIASSSFVMVTEGAAAFDKPGGKKVSTLSADRLYAMDYDTPSPQDWMAIHLPQGGVGFTAVPEQGLEKPYGTGLCFKKTAKGWQMMAQVSTGL